ncbi:hypothetical protein PO909_000634 [Leuciscus waleckii]
MFDCKTLSTLITCEWLFSRVNSHVKLKKIFVCETLSTLITREQLLSGVNSHVSFKV